MVGLRGDAVSCTDEAARADDCVYIREHSFRFSEFSPFLCPSGLKVSQLALIIISESNDEQFEQINFYNSEEHA